MTAQQWQQLLYRLPEPAVPLALVQRLDFFVQPHLLFSAEPQQLNSQQLQQLNLLIEHWGSELQVQLLLDHQLLNQLLEQCTQQLWSAFES